MLVPLIALMLQAVAAASPTIECSSADPAGCRTSIYFDSGEGSTIRPEWSASLDAVAARLRHGERLHVDGYADRSGPRSTNRLYSERRVKAVVRALEQRHLSATLFIVAIHGEDDPLVPTADGVREPQNRRVDLTIEP